MKTNEAPEKIYIHPDIGGREFLRPWLHRPANNESVEYIRTDAVIEKAAEYLMEYEFNDSPTIADRRKRVDEFIKYIKGE